MGNTGVVDAGRLVLAGTPIGNLSDASQSLRDALAGADVIAAEDTRRLRALLTGLGVESAARVVSNFEGNEASRVEGLLAELLGGAVVVLVTDAGMPLVSDPGFRLARAAIDAGVPVGVVPGPSAVLVALALSGLPSDRFCFEGFPPRKGSQRRRRLGELAAERRTMVFYEAPHRLADFLRDSAAAFGPDRQASVSRELTKLFEETRRGTLAALAEWAAEGVRGEVTVCVAGAPEPSAPSLEEAVAEVLSLAGSGVKLSTAAAEVAVRAGHPKKALYDAALAARG
ncbi:MAG: 16S rRNA (cytidine(1402)-2'-O)-methyltransferase [Propionibacteriaceae bacterium]|jgi:16S rRNA (cytidine1402-2'-O)-methyltransferase|nr:16S rRNA (cytidine(1402)-2'-O)-methyltransferase [Propionibacteriaceae bacterium]